MTTLGGFSAGAIWEMDYLAAAQRNVLGGFKSECSAWIKSRLKFLDMKFQASVQMPYVVTPAGCCYTNKLTLC